MISLHLFECRVMMKRSSRRWNIVPYFFCLAFIALSINVLMLTKILSKAATNGMETLSPVCLPTERPSTPLGCSALLVLSALFVSTTQLRSQLKGHFSHQTRVWDKTNLCFRSHPLSCNGRWAGSPKVGSNKVVELAGRNYRSCLGNFPRFTVGLT